MNNMNIFILTENKTIVEDLNDDVKLKVYCKSKNMFSKKKEYLTMKF